MLLSELEPGQNAIVESVGGPGSIRRHLLDMGLTPNALVTLQKIAPRATQYRSRCVGSS